MKKILLIALALIVSACTSIVKVEGDQVINDRMMVKVTDAWNKVTLPGSDQPFDLWTQEGFPLDQLRFWAAIKPGQALVAPPTKNSADVKAQRVATFNAGMTRDQLVSQFEIMYAADGSLVNVTKVEARPFAGENGVRFEFTVARKGDDVQMMGVGWASVRKDELFAATFVAPKLSFFGRLLPRAEAVVSSAKIRD